MPNWTENTLIVSGGKKEIKRFKEFVSIEEEILIPKSKLKEEYDKEMADKEYWRERLEEYLICVKMTPKKYFKEIKRYHFNSKGDVAEHPCIFSFNKIKPRPKSLNITSGSATDNGMAVILAEEYNNYSKIDEMLGYAWNNERNGQRITTREDMIKHIKESGMANIEEGRMAVENLKYYGHKDWYSWSSSMEGWGTKWDACDTDLDEISDEELIYHFNTAWSPPTPVIEKASQIFPKLRFRLEYTEPGCDFSGILECEGGEIVNDECGKYIDYNSQCNECGCELESRDGIWHCPSCDVKVCPDCQHPAESNETTECDNCGYLF